MKPRKSRARKNMMIGPMTEFWTRESPRTRQLRKNLGSSSYLTLARGGYIIRISPMGMGIEVVPTERRFTRSATDGMKYPSTTPITIARRIQNDRKRLTTERRGPQVAGIWPVVLLMIAPLCGLLAVFF